VGAEADDDGLPVSLEGLPVFERYGLLLAGYSLPAHEILRRPSEDLDFATQISAGGSRDGMTTWLTVSPRNSLVSSGRPMTGLTAQ
jgi:hypothetical protein